MKWIVTALGFYAIIACAVVSMHMIYLPMVTPGLAFVRGAVWPLWMLTSRPRGQRMRMD